MRRQSQCKLLPSAPYLGLVLVLMSEDEDAMTVPVHIQQQSVIEQNEPEAGVTQHLSNGWSGFKIVGDNIDKNVRRSFQRLDMQT